MTMKQIIRNMLIKASEEKDLELAEMVSDLMYELAITLNAPSDWRSILDELHEEFKDNEWLVESVYEFGMYD